MLPTHCPTCNTPRTGKNYVRCTICKNKRVRDKRGATKGPGGYTAAHKLAHAKRHGTPVACSKCGEMRKVGQECKECRKKYDSVKAYYLANRKKIKQRRILATYGLTWDEYTDMLNATGGICPICNVPFAVEFERRVNGRSACVDHDHETGKVRGIICGRCNMAIGQLNSIARLQSAEAYFHNHAQE